MSTQIKTLAMKARVYNKIRTFLYKQRLENISDKTKTEFFDEIFKMNQETHWELNAYKQKRKDQRELRKKREAAPQTKTMKKRLNPKKTSKFEHQQSLSIMYNVIMNEIAQETTKPK